MQVVHSQRSGSSMRVLPSWTLRKILRGPYDPTASTGHTGTHFAHW